MSEQPQAAPFVGSGKPHDRVVATVCQECTVGCGLLTYVKDDVIVDIQGDRSHPVNQGRLCARGIAFVQCLTHPDRVLVPAARGLPKGKFEAVDNLDKGIDLLAEQLRRIKDRHGPESLWIGCEAEAGLDFQLAAQRFAALWGTPHVYPLDRSLASPQSTVTRTPAALTFHHWETAPGLLLVNTDAALTHPVAFRHVLEARRRGAKVVAADSWFTATLSKADIALIIRPGSGNIFGLALMKVLLEEGLCDRDSIAANFAEPDQWQQSFAAMSLDEAVSAIGISLTELVETARLLAANSPVLAITGKRAAAADHHGVWPTLAVASGWSQAGGGWYPLESGRPAVDPTADLPEESLIANTDPVRRKAQRASGAAETEAGEESPKALICGGDCLEDLYPALKAGPLDTELIVHFGALRNYTRNLSHMTFPAKLWAERESLSFNDDGLVQWGRPIVPPDGACMSGLGFWTRLAERFGWQEYFPRDTGRERADHRLFYQRLLGRHPATASIDVAALASGTVAELPRIDPLEAPAAPMTPEPAPATFSSNDVSDDGADFPLSFQAMPTLSRQAVTAHQAPWLQELEAADLVRIHPELADRLTIENGDTVFLTTGTQTLCGRARITRAVTPRMACAPYRLGTDRVLLYKSGQDPSQARQILKEMSS